MWTSEPWTVSRHSRHEGHQSCASGDRPEQCHQKPCPAVEATGTGVQEREGGSPAGQAAWRAGPLLVPSPLPLSVRSVEAERGTGRATAGRLTRQARAARRPEKEAWVRERSRQAERRGHRHPGPSRVFRGKPSRQMGAPLCWSLRNTDGSRVSGAAGRAGGGLRDERGKGRDSRASVMGSSGLCHAVSSL